MTRQERELVEAVERAQRCAGRVESRRRLKGEPPIVVRNSMKPIRVGLTMADRTRMMV